ncbi:hypothetical protein Pla175_48420 [Pirellulimonas nuda]|uniref:DUF5615 domain-containing protein n=1 Tax=Pirellulimonas nuda TaxID=2528009 RepID=A0A518DIW2_9BACT|nr:DUF5615 family PIN-like protein [Pirellulimonas nuda]QDU91419.1 hypothetical protein Pla175_48420 [Pirellulimonas nuda]
MKILFDQGTPVPLRLALSGHDVATAAELGWSRLSNGELIAAAETSGFECMITTDQNLKYQQNLTQRKVAIVVLLSASWPRIRAHCETVLAAVESTPAGGYREVPIGQASR